VALRSKARVFAMQMLFQWDMGQQDIAKLETKFWKAARAVDHVRVLANQLLEGAAHDVAALDELIAQYAKNWRVERMSSIDRAILRLALHEMRATDTPTKVVIDEAVKLAKTYSADESSAFVNGLLDTYRKSLQMR
jgi:N utilization substance protein B